MGQLSITIGTTASPRTRTRTIADGLFASRIIPALRANYGQVFDNTLNPPAFRDRTNNEVLDALFDSFESALKDMVKRTETETARTGATAGITDLPIT